VEVEAFRERLIAAVRTADYAAVDVLADEMGVADVGELVDLHDVVASAMGDAAIEDHVRESLSRAWLRALALTPRIRTLRSKRLHDMGLRGLEDESWLVRAYAAESFSYLGDESHVPLLMRVALDPAEHPTVRADAVDAAMANAPHPSSTIELLRQDIDADPSLLLRVVV
jgi:HEAT repeat protein